MTRGIEPKRLNYARAEMLRARAAELLRELAAFTDGEEDSVEDGAEPDPEYIDALSDACLHLDSACIALDRI